MWITLKSKFRILSSLFYLFILLSPIRVIGSGNTILIDGNLNDWIGIDPIFIEEEVHPDYWLDIQKAFITANDTNLFVRIDYNTGLDYLDSLFANLTVRTPANEVFILMAQVIFDTTPHWSFSAIFHGINLSSPYNDPEMYEAVAMYENTVEIDLTTNKSIEFAYSLTDLGAQVTDYLDVTFWHYDTIQAGEALVLFHTFAETVYKVSLDTLANRSSSSTSAPTAIDESHTSSDVVYGFNWIIGLLIIVIVVEFKRKR